MCLFGSSGLDVRQGGLRGRAHASADQSIPGAKSVAQGPMHLKRGEQAGIERHQSFFKHYQRIVNRIHNIPAAWPVNPVLHRQFLPALPSSERTLPMTQRAIAAAMACVCAFVLCCVTVSIVPCFFVPRFLPSCIGALGHFQSGNAARTMLDRPAVAEKPVYF